MRNAVQMTIEKTHPRLVDEIDEAVSQYYNVKSSDLISSVQPFWFLLTDILKIEMYGT